MKKWETVHKRKAQREKLKINEVIKILLENRGLKAKKEIEEFLNPKLESVTSKTVSIDQSQLKKAIKRIQKAIKEKEQIIVYGDYDVDGICGTAILWEMLHSLGAKILPYIPHRIDEGYGLSIQGIDNIKNKIENIKLIITVDNGVVANAAVAHAKKQGIDVVITDHHVPSTTKPKAYAIVHTTMLCGTGVAWLLSQVILNSFQDLRPTGNEMPKQVRHDMGKEHLELVALATVADLVPLKGHNRTLLTFGLEELRKTKRIGLLELFKEAALDKNTIGTYEIGHIIAPRLNAMGRLEYAMESLRLLCTKNPKKAEDLARLLGTTNRERQLLTQGTVLHAKSVISNKQKAIRKLLFISHESYQQGIIGLVAGKLVEEFYRPAIVVAKGDKHSKASARSIHGFNIIEFIRGASEFLVDAGGHPMAAGFTVETEKLLLLEKKLHRLAEKLLDENMFTRLLRIDLEIPSFLITEELYKNIQQLAPFGMGNPEPTFMSKGLIIQDMRLVGREGKHLKLKLKVQSAKLKVIDAIAFGMGERIKDLHIGDTVDVAYSISLDTWPGRNATQRVAGGNGNNKLQLKVKDIKK